MRTASYLAAAVVLVVAGFTAYFVFTLTPFLGR